MFDVPWRKGLCGDRIRAGGFRLQIWSGGDQRLPFCSAITAARFFIAVRKGEAIPGSLIAPNPQPGWHPAALTAAYAGMTAEAKRNWVWWDIALTAPRTSTFSQLVEEIPTGVPWHTAAHTQYLLELMTPLHRQKVARAMTSGQRTVGTIYRRTRPDEDGTKRQRAEVRFDDIAGCLRTPAGGSSRQTILVVEGKTVRSRLCRPGKPRNSWGSATPTGCRSATTTRTMSAATAFACQWFGIWRGAFWSRC